MSNAPPTPIMTLTDGNASAWRAIHRSCFGAPSPTSTIAGAAERIVSTISSSRSAGRAEPSSSTSTPAPATTTFRPGSVRHLAAARSATSGAPPTNATVSPRSAASLTRNAAISTPGHRRTVRPSRSVCTSVTPVPSGSARSAERSTSAYAASLRARRRISGFGVKIRNVRSPSRNPVVTDRSWSTVSSSSRRTPKMREATRAPRAGRSASRSAHPRGATEPAARRSRDTVRVAS